MSRHLSNLAIVITALAAIFSSNVTYAKSHETVQEYRQRQADATPHVALFFSS